MERVFGFEILPAPFVISHLQLGLLLQNIGAPLADDGTERAGVFLTNSLTGWEPPKGAKVQLTLPEMQAERDAADKVKRKDPILVVIGNPPYNAFAGVSPEEEEGLVETYKGAYQVEKVNQRTGKTAKDRHGNPVRKRRYRLSDPEARGGWGIRKFNLDDLYVRFFRLAERRIAEVTGRGVVCFISNSSWVTEPSFVILREHLLESFNRVWIENLHGDRKRSEYAPDGRTSETIFAIPGFSPGIKQGVATTLWVKTGEPSPALVLLRNDINAAKAADRRAQLLQTLEEINPENRYSSAAPAKDNRYSFWPMVVSADYAQWPKIIDLCAVPPSNGLMEKRGGSLVDIGRDALEERLKIYFDRSIEWQDYKALGHRLARKQARFDPKKAREKAIAAEKFLPERIVRYAVRPFDIQWAYYTGVRPVWNEPRPALWEQVWQGNGFLLTRLRSGKDPEGAPMYFTPFLSDDHLLSPDAVAIPGRLRTRQPGIRGALFEGQEGPPAQIGSNLSVRAEQILSHLAADARKEDSTLWMHALGIGYSPAYLNENADGVRRDWPRIPLPATKDALLKSAELGERIAALLNTEAEVKNVTSGASRPELKIIGNITAVEGGTLDPARDLLIDAGWGHGGKGGITMPGKGKLIGRDYTAAERGAVAEGAAALGLTKEQAFGQLGERTCDVYLNARAYWKNIPAKVWDYYIGGYQVIKKWLSYREGKLLGRALTVEEARYVRDMARRIAALCLLQPELDANYAAVKADTYPWRA